MFEDKIEYHKYNLETIKKNTKFLAETMSTYIACDCLYFEGEHTSSYGFCLANFIFMVTIL